MPEIRMTPAEYNALHFGARPGSGGTALRHYPGADILANPQWNRVNTGWGTLRASHSAIVTENLRANLLRVPGGQRAPWHGSGGWPEFGEAFPPVDRGMIYFLTMGEVDFDGYDTNLRMKEHDFLKISATIYSYTNSELDEARFWCLGVWPDRADGMGERVWSGDEHADTMMGSHPYYLEEPKHLSEMIPDARERMSIVRWDDYKRSKIEWHGSWGSNWGAYPFVEAGVRARVLRIPPAQIARRPSMPHDALFIGIDGGSLQLSVRDTVCDLSPYDVLAVPSTEDIVMVNMDKREVLVLEVVPSRRATQGSG